MLLDLFFGRITLQAFIIWLLLFLPGFIIGLCCHEFGHAWMAVKSGDDTPRMMGRLTLNPVKHLDPMGFACILVARFGWAKPVMINSRNVGSAGGKYRNWMIGISLAGITLNLCLAALFLLLHAGLCILFGAAYVRSGLWFSLMRSTYEINILLAVFNFLPVPPLDGFNFLKALFPRAQWFYQIERYGMFILLALILSGATSYIFNTFMGPFSDLFSRVTFNITGALPWL